MTHVIEDFIDSLKVKTGDSDARGLALSEAMPLAKPLEEKALRCPIIDPLPCQSYGLNWLWVNSSSPRHS
ncbi:MULTISPECIES: hypothetical protein [Calothrix]|uniref:Uncharacterized protein n=2 Tax=Calothrix TaxID=1186 RepID=A0ABR8A5A2_9CYAN|nr:MULTISPECIES: hypothetical protein [Calothrix]MBD2194779.1 hypothetical protein [Calothrix parietina FACHB-288]MBD2225071.1 hypothetical protein [Calothrix anomala FACHB-343]